MAIKEINEKKEHIHISDDGKTYIHSHDSNNGSTHKHVH